MAGDFRDLKVWQKARALAVDVYGVTRRSDILKDYVFCDQMRRAVLSIVSNIAEGNDRSGGVDSARFFGMAKGSCAELHAQAILAHDVGYLDDKDLAAIEQQCSEIARMLSGLMKARRAHP